MSDKASYTAADSLPVKLLKDERVISSINDRHIIPPIHIQFLPTNKCNLNCPFCSCANEDRNIEMSLFKAMEIIDICKDLGTKAVTITGGGSPCLHPNINEIIEHFIHCGIEVGLVDNGLALEKIKPEILNKVTWCRISHADFRSFSDKYEEKLKKVIASAPDVDWAFSYVVSKTPNIYGIIKAINFSNDHNFTHIRLVADLFNPEEIDMDRVKNIIDAFGVDDEKVIYQNRSEPTKGGDCYIGFLKPVISADYQVYNCCIEENESVIIEKNGVLSPVAIKDVNEGDFAYGNGRVLKKFDSGFKDGLKITLQNNRSIYVSKDHIMIKPKNINITHKIKKEIDYYELDEVVADKLRVGDLIPVKYNLENSYSTCEIDDDDLYLYGAYLAEGWCQKKSNGFGFMLGLHETEKKDKLVKILGDSVNVYERRTGWQIMCHDKEVKGVISQFGENGYFKQIPDFIFSLSREQKEYFLKAYFDGDGHLVKPSKSRNGYLIVFSTISKKLASDLILLLATIGVHATLSEVERDHMVIEGRDVSCHNIFRVKIGGDYNFEKLTLWDEIKRVSPSGRSPKRALGFLKDGDTMLVPIKKIEECGEIKCFDIMVEGTHKFYSSFGILTHNCGVQYYKKDAPKKLPIELSLGSAFDMKDIVARSSKPANGNICEICYYSDYNNILGAMMKNVEHINFV